jgi:hypothetical protein
MSPNPLYETPIQGRGQGASFTIVASNLAVACWYCNSFKGSDISGLGPQTRKLTRLFHPRRHKWGRHFRYEGPVLIGQTAIGRTTIRVLQINCDEAVTLRESLIAEGLF